MDANITLSGRGPAAFADGFASAPLEAKAKAFSRMEEAIALERACSSLELAASVLAKHAWIKELGLRWRSPSVAGGIGLKISPGFAESDSALAQSGSSLSSIIDFAILAAKLADGSLDEADSSIARGMAESMRPAFILGARGDGFNGSSAREARGLLALAENELGKALAWASRAEAAWLPNSLLRNSWEKKALRDQAVSGNALAQALGLPALAAELERREIAHLSPDPRSAHAPRGL